MIKSGVWINTHHNPRLVPRICIVATARQPETVTAHASSAVHRCNPSKAVTEQGNISGGAGILDLICAIEEKDRVWWMGAGFRMVQGRRRLCRHQRGAVMTSDWRGLGRVVIVFIIESDAWLDHEENMSKTMH